MLALVIVTEAVVWAETSIAVAANASNGSSLFMGREG
jgi:hypothetical protein